MPIEFAARIRRMPVYPLAAGYDLGAERAMLASNESAFAPCPRWWRPRAGRWQAPTATRTRPTCHCAARWPPRYGIPPRESPWATAPATSCCTPARRCSSRGQRSSTPGLRSALPAPGRGVGRPGDRGPLDDEDRHDLDAIAAEVTVATRLVLICNPNNPTSTALGLEEIDAFLKRIPGHVCVILDEAYCEFALSIGDTYASLELLRKYPNLVLLRTFSKVYGLAALRVGYALCATEDFRIAVDQVRQPFYLNAAAQAAAVEALCHQDEVERRVTETIAERLALEEARARARAVGGGRRELHLAAPARDCRGGATSWLGCGTGACSSGLAPRSAGGSRFV